MDRIVYIGVALYIVVISLVSVIVCSYDKIAAKKWQRHRVPEATLLLLSAVGGSTGMLVTMLFIRHKTKHKKFMIGIPLIILLQLALCGVAVYFYYFR